mmetsp:Transcript_24275/g.54609  ORF Transcript_24275/g.54609 Transcript_24275/m.54609 type:complete len:200 (+) Transcript_24275:3366-3965(+)|eukprot:750627-Hanusia_phi.AAC.1
MAISACVSDRPAAPVDTARCIVAPILIDAIVPVCFLERGADGSFKDAEVPSDASDCVCGCASLPMVESANLILVVCPPLRSLSEVLEAEEGKPSSKSLVTLPSSPASARAIISISCSGTPNSSACRLNAASIPVWLRITNVKLCFSTILLSPKLSTIGTDASTPTSSVGQSLLTPTLSASGVPRRASGTCSMLSIVPRW